MTIRLYNVSNRLPVTVGEKITKSSGGLVAALEGLSGGGDGGGAYDLRWIGWPGGEVPDDRRGEVEQTLRRDFGCTPVFLNREEEKGHYEGFSNESLWPLLHAMPGRFRYEPGWWDYYHAVNRRFADAVLADARDGDLVWVHDYQLLLLPAMLKEARPSLRVGFFLHTPFPPYELFRCHPDREELARGMLGADLVGFHTAGYLQNFSAAVLRLLGIESQVTEVRHEDGRSTVLGVYPIGINAPKFDRTLDSPEFAQQLQAFKETQGDKRVILSVERLDYTKGLPERLDAIDLFLEEWEDRDAIKFIFVAVPSREGVEEYRALREEVESRVGRLNGKYATLHNSPIHFVHDSVEFNELCALYALADVGLVTPLIDGMNLVAKEYVAAQRSGGGVLVLSEFAGAAEELFNAVMVNPYDTRAMAEALCRALGMSPQERRERMRPMRDRVMRFDARAWARSFIEDLASRDPQPRAAAAGDPEEARRRLAEALAGGRRVAMFLDYDGTLREIVRDPSAAGLTPAVREVLDLLRGRSSGPAGGIDVTIISGRTREDLEAWLGDYPFGLIAEHGAEIRRPGRREWERLDREVSYAWKEPLLKLLRVYEASTPGSFVEEKRTSLVWHYRSADPEYGRWKANALAAELAALVANDPVQVRHGKKIVEITAAQVNKGAAVARILEAAPRYDLVLCAGDDVTDESMLSLAHENLIAIKVGDGQTKAGFILPNPSALRALLKRVLTGAGR